MTTAQIVVKVGFNQGWNVASAATYTTITTANKVRSLYITRGKKDALSKLQTGRCILEVDNTNGYLDPSNTDAPSPYQDSGATQVLPGRKIDIEVISPKDGSTIQLFGGFVERWVQQSRGHGHDQVTIIEAVDFMKGMAQAKCDATTRPAETTGERFSALAGMASSALIRGYTTLMETAPEKTYTKTMNVLDEIDKVNDAEVGIVFSERSISQVEMLSRAEVLAGGETRPGILGQFTDDTGADSGWLPYHDVKMFWDDDKITNLANATVYDTATNATEATDATSQTRYGVRGRDETALMLNSAASATTWCDYLVDRQKEPDHRVSSLTFFPQADTGLWSVLLTADPGNLYQVRRHPATGATVTHIVQAEGIVHKADANRWTTTMNFSSDKGGAYWVLDSDGSGGYAALSTLATTTKLAYLTV